MANKKGIGTVGGRLRRMPGMTVEDARKAKEDLLMQRFKKFREKQRNKPVTPLEKGKGKMKKKSGPKPGSMDYFLQETMKPGYKGMQKGGIMDDIVENMGKDFDYQTRIKVRKKMKEAPDQDAVEAFDEAERDAMKKVEKKYTGKNKYTGKMSGGLSEATKKLKAQGLSKGGNVCRGMGAALRGGDFKGVK